MNRVEFAPDLRSPVYEHTISMLRLHRVAPESRAGYFELVRVSVARAILEVGTVGDAPGVRIMNCWVATPQANSLEAAKALAGNRPPMHRFAASVRRTGGLAVTTCIGCDEYRTGVRIPFDRLTATPLVTDVSLDAIPRGKGLDELVAAHLRAAPQAFDPLETAKPEDVDVPLYELFQALPDTTLRAAGV